MPRKIAIVLAVILLPVLALVGFVATRAGDFKVERSQRINAPSEVVFAQVVDFHKWDAWSPWAKLDPHMKSAHEGEAGAVGSSYSWQGNEKVGEGRMTLVEANPPGVLKIRLEFIKPFAATNEIVFAFKPAENGTNATWTMIGTNNFVGKAFSLVKSVDQAVGPDFEKGLAQLGAVAAAEAKKIAAAAAPETAAEAAAGDSPEPTGAAPAIQ